MPISANSRTVAGTSILGTSNLGTSKLGEPSLGLSIFSSKAAPSDPPGPAFDLMVASVMIPFPCLGGFGHESDRRLPARKLLRRHVDRSPICLRPICSHIPTFRQRHEGHEAV